MKPFFKYSGGKSREAKLIASITSCEFVRVVEPFCGSCAISFHLERPALVCDVRHDVITTLQVVKDPTLYPKLKVKLDALKQVVDVLELEREFYRQRDDMWGTTDPLEIAYRFIVVRQLVFSGIDRVNSKTGKENAPFGWYKQFKCNLSDDHHRLLQTWEIKQQPIEMTLNECRPNDFVFLDPPYLDRNSTYAGIEPDLAFHKQLQASLDTLESDWLLVHCQHPEYEDFAQRHNTKTRDFSYSQNFVGRDNTKQKVKHLYVRKG